MSLQILRALLVARTQAISTALVQLQNVLPDILSRAEAAPARRAIGRSRASSRGLPPASLQSLASSKASLPMLKRFAAESNSSTSLPTYGQDQCVFALRANMFVVSKEVRGESKEVFDYSAEDPGKV